MLIEVKSHEGKTVFHEIKGFNFSGIRILKSDTSKS